TRFQDENHPYAADIDLFGTGSLFELLCTARTRTGENTLAGWLLKGAAPAEVRARQEAVAELRSMLDLREDLALLGGDVPAGGDFDGVAAWGSAPAILTTQWPRWAALAIGLTSLTCLFGWILPMFDLVNPVGPFWEFFLYWGSLPFVLVLTVELAFT